VRGRAGSPNNPRNCPDSGGTQSVPPDARCPLCSGKRVECFTRISDRHLAGLPESRISQEKTWGIFHCLDCSLGWTFPLPTTEELSAYYPSSYSGDARSMIEAYKSGRLQRSRSWKTEEEKVRFVERHRNRGSILDVGCGDGKFLLALSPRRWQRTGFEQIGAAVEQARAAVPDIRFVVGNFESSDLQEESFDVVTFWHVFEHLADPQAVLARTLRLLRPGGIMALGAPNFGSWQPRLFRHHWYAFDPPRHLFHYSPRSLSLLLDKAGFQLVEFRAFGRRISLHQLKYSLITWAESSWKSRVPYYLLKPFILAAGHAEQWVGSYGGVGAVARKAGASKGAEGVGAESL
jgi:SAM-dependent methyltransferase